MVSKIGFKDVDEFIIYFKLIEGYEDVGATNLEIILANGSKEMIYYPETTEISQTIESTGTYTYEVKRGEETVSKSIEVSAVKEKIDQTKIFLHEGGVITGIKEEYLTYTPQEISEEPSTYGMIKPRYLTKEAGYPYLTIPEEIDGIPITSIAPNAFQDIFNIGIVEIPNSVTSIGNRAFGGCQLLEIINIGNNVTTIEQYAFNNTAIREVFIPKNVATIGEYAFISNRYQMIINCEAESQPSGWNQNWYNTIEGKIVNVNWNVTK